MKAEVVIIGGGPGGSTAALCLIERGLRPVIVEKDTQATQMILWTFSLDGSTPGAIPGGQGTQRSDRLRSLNVAASVTAGSNEELLART